MLRPCLFSAVLLLLLGCATEEEPSQRLVPDRKPVNGGHAGAATDDGEAGDAGNAGQSGETGASGKPAMAQAGQGGTGSAGKPGTGGTGGTAGKTGGDAGAGGNATGGNATGGNATGGNANGGNAGASGNAGAGGNTTGGNAGAGGSAPLSCPVTLAPIFTYTLENAAFPGTGHPDAAVHVPPGFDACASPGLIVFFHGFDNCVENVLGSTNTACTPGGAKRTALHLADQLDASGANAILVAVEIAFDKATGNPGALVEKGRLRALLDEIFQSGLSNDLGAPLDVAAFDRVVLASHSGGYWAVAESLTNGGLPNVREIDLYDSLYGKIATYQGFLDDHAASFSSSAEPPYRFVDVWTSGGGTADESVSLQADAAATLGAVGLSSSLLYDPTNGTLTDDDYTHPVIFKHSALSHDGVPQYYFERVTRQGFAPRPLP